MKALAWVILVVGTLYLLWSWTDQLKAVREVIREVRAGQERRE